MSQQGPAQPGPDRPPARVTTLELFFDLVFAFIALAAMVSLEAQLAVVTAVLVAMLTGEHYLAGAGQATGAAAAG